MGSHTFSFIVFRHTASRKRTHGGRGRGAGDSAGAADQAALSSQKSETAVCFRHPPIDGAAVVENNPRGQPSALVGALHQSRRAWDMKYLPQFLSGQKYGFFFFMTRFYGVE